MKTAPTVEDRPSLDPPVAPVTGSETRRVDAPDRPGWWWARSYNQLTGEAFEWYCQQVLERNGVLGYEYEDGEFLPLGGGRCDWAGPLTPPAESPNDEAQRA